MNHEKQFDFDFSEIPALTADQISSLSIDLSSGQDNIMASGINDALISMGGSGSIDTLTLSNTSPYTFTATTVSPGMPSSSNTIFTIGSNSGVTNPWTTGNSSGKISLTGDKADIEVNGKSLMKVLEGLEERLNLLTPNVELESDWEELAELGQKYRELETKIKEKVRTWDILKSMPPPKID
jgi:hypothetical protein